MSEPKQEIYCDGDGGCTCREYSPPDDPKPGEKQLCTECLHGKSRHPKVTNPNPDLPPPQEVEDQADASENSKGKVAKIYGQLTSATRSYALRDQAVSKTGLQNARKEVLDGFRSTSGPQASGSTKRKLAATAKGPGANTRSASSNIKVVTANTWCLLVNYIHRVNREDVLTSTSPLGLVDMSLMRKHGCAYLEPNNLAFSIKGTHKELDTYLREIFPALWALVCKENRKLRICPEDFPTGENLFTFKGRRKGPTSDTSIIIASLIDSKTKVFRKAIPEKVYASWATSNPITTYQEGDSDSDDDCIEIIDGDDDEYPSGRSLRPRQD
ncbi:hypothetical protein BJ138DRAFT_1108040, partial [Hygrophoropsis aurantiaca]